MERYKLDLTKYEIDDKDGKVNYPLRENLSSCLRAVGVFNNGEEIVEAVVLAKSLLAREEDDIILDEREVVILKKCINRHLELAFESKCLFGGPAHEELIFRVFSMEKEK